MPQLSIIIVNYKSWEVLTRCLDSIAAQSFQHLETIVIDNFSADVQLATFEKKYPKVRFLERPLNEGFAKACNFGASIALSPVFLFLNPDTVLNEETLSSVLDFSRGVEETSIISVNQSTKAAKLHLSFPTILSALGIGFKKTFSTFQYLEHKYISPDWVSGSFVWIQKSFFYSIGAWSEKYFMYFEDVDLCLKANKAGGKIYAITNTHIEHVHGGASRKTVNTAAFSKATVLQSEHIYFATHFDAPLNSLYNTLLFGKNIMIGLIPVLFFPIGFWNKKIQIRTLMFINVIRNYKQNLQNLSWHNKKL